MNMETAVGAVTITNIATNITMSMVTIMSIAMNMETAVGAVTITNITMSIITIMTTITVTITIIMTMITGMAVDADTTMKKTIHRMPPGLIHILLRNTIM